MAIKDIKEMCKKTEVFKKLYSLLYKLVYYRYSKEHNKILEKYQEKIVSFGEENPDKIFYVIYSVYAVNIIAFVRFIIPYIKYADTKGYIPVIDSNFGKHNFLGFIGSSPCNTWELFFEQPCNYSLEDISHSKNIIYCNPLGYPENTSQYFLWSIKETDALPADFFNLINKYIKVKNDLKNKIFSRCASLLYDKNIYLKNNNIIGLTLRVGMLWGALSKSNFFIDHKYVTAFNYNEQIKNAVKMVKNSEYDFIFFMCDDENVKRKYVQNYDIKYFIAFNRHFSIYYFIDGDLNKPCSKRDYWRRNTEHEFEYYIEKNIEYLSEIYMLSKCNTVVGGENDSAVIAAFLLRQKDFKDIIFIPIQKNTSKVKERGFLCIDKETGCVIQNGINI